MSSKQLTISDFESWLSNFPAETHLKFTLNGDPIEWAGGSREAAFETDRGSLSKVNETVAVEFKHGPYENPQ